VSLLLILEFGDAEIKHWPCVFAGVGPKVRAWLKDSGTGATLELPGVQKIDQPYALRASWMVGHYRVVFEGGEFTASEDDVEVRRPVVIDGERAAKALQLEGAP
jgi:hypothetical protein